MAKVAHYAYPEILYRFRSINPDNWEREMRCIKRGEIYCGKFSNLNDPMEGVHRESALFRKSKNYDGSMSKIRREMESIGVASLSECRNSETMWAHYAGQFSGILISYRFKRLVRSTPSECKIVRMVYNEVPPVFLRDNMPLDQRARLALSTKTLKWADEREWRLLAPEIGSIKYEDEKTVKDIVIGARFDRKRFLGELKEICLDLEIKLLEMKVGGYQLEYSEVL